MLHWWRMETSSPNDRSTDIDKAMASSSPVQEPGETDFERLKRGASNAKDKGLKAIAGVREKYKRFTQKSDHEGAVFLGMTVSGMLRGALYGAVAAIIGIAIFSGLAAIGTTLFFCCMGAGAIAYGIRDSQGHLEDRMNDREERNEKKVSPGKLANIDRAHAQEVDDEVDAILDKNKGFLSKENARREAAAAARGQREV